MTKESSITVRGHIFSMTDGQLKKAIGCLKKGRGVFLEGDDDSVIGYLSPLGKGISIQLCERLIPCDRVPDIARDRGIGIDEKKLDSIEKKMLENGSLRKDGMCCVTRKRRMPEDEWDLEKMIDSAYGKATENADNKINSIIRKCGRGK